MRERPLVKLLCAGLLTASCLSSQAAEANFSECSHFFHQSKPPFINTEAVPGATRDLCFSEFAVLHSGETRTPLFVAQKLSAHSLEQGEGLERTDRFYEEARLPSKDRAWLSDYNRSGFDRGHLAPARDMATPEGMAQSFSLANIVPQAPQHNRKLWRKIEQDTRNYIQRTENPVYVITGAHFSSKQASRIGRSGRGVAIPDALYKLVIDPTRQRAWAHWLDNHDNARIGRPISIEELKKRTGIDFLS